jgi:uncharacterized protein YdhG (YjbR/CyaY superfamily)
VDSTTIRAVKRAGAGAVTVDGYLAKLSPDQRRALTAVRGTVRKTAPDAVESISYGIPTFKQDGRPLVYFSAATKHLTVHAIDPDLLEEAARRGFGTGRGSIRFTPERPIPDALLVRIVKSRLPRLSKGAAAYGTRPGRRAR